MKKIIFLYILLIPSCDLLYAQHPEIKRTNHWYFGENAGVDFSDSSVLADLNGALNSYESSASISDTSGNLLFYTDGETVWNPHHQIMQNGTNIGGCWSSTQGVLIVPKPENDTVYYIFTVDCGENNFMNGLRYSIVNINLDNGLGAVVQKNVLLHSLVVEKLAGVHHSNGNDIWLVTHELNSSNFLSYLITSNGIDTVPTISSVGSVHNSNISLENYDAIGQMKFSPNRKKIISVKFTSATVELFDFNDSTGEVFNALTITSGGNFPIYGASFSPDNTKLYISNYTQGGTNPVGGKLYQYNLLAGTSSNIISSKFLVFSSTFYTYGPLQNGANGKIYLAKENTTSSTVTPLGVINEPNEIGALCNFSENGFNLSGRNCQRNLPNFIESYFNCDTCTIDSSNVGIFETVNKADNIFIFPNPIENFIFIKSLEKIESWNIKDINGLALYRDELDNQESNIEVSNLNLPKGIYTLSVKTKSCNHIQKLIKLTN
jgi:hypothetical protein